MMNAEAMNMTIDVEELRYYLDNNTKWNIYVKRKKAEQERKENFKQNVKDCVATVGISALLMNDWNYTIDHALKFFGM